MPRTIYIDPLTLPDSAARHIWAENSLSDSQREDLYDLVTKSADTPTLAKHLSVLPLRPEFKGKLLNAKNRMIADSTEPEHPAIIAAKRIGELASTPEGAKMLEIAETHPRLLHALLAGNAKSK
jgi:hypothetical protein